MPPHSRAQLWGAGPPGGSQCCSGTGKRQGTCCLSPSEDLGLCKGARAQPAAPWSARHRLKCEFACSVSSPALACSPTEFWNLGRGSRTLHAKPCGTIPQPRLTFSAHRLGPPSRPTPGPRGSSSWPHGEARCRNRKSWWWCLYLPSKVTPSSNDQARPQSLVPPLSLDLASPFSLSPLTSPRCHTSSIARSQGLALLPQNTRHPRTEPGALPTCCVTENRPVRSPGSLHLLWAPVHSIY